MKQFNNETYERDYFCSLSFIMLKIKEEIIIE